MILATDTHYSETASRTAGVWFREWSDEQPAGSCCLESNQAPEEYEPGEFWRRELPPILALVEQLDFLPKLIIVDGYVWLDAQGRKGLGAHLHEALAGKIPVVGVAKHSFRGSAHAISILRGQSERPLFVTSAGIDPERAAKAIVSMHGAYRQPDLLKLADSLCRGS